MRIEQPHGIPTAPATPRYARTELIMGLPITVVVADIGEERCSHGAGSASDVERAMAEAAAELFDSFRAVDERFSPYRPTSEVSKMNRGELRESGYSPEMRRVLRLSEETRQATEGYFDVWQKGRLDPSGLVKGLAVHDASAIMRRRGFANFCIDAGGDIEVRGRWAAGDRWRIGIRNPFDPGTIVKTLELEDRGIATSGLYARGEHIYDPITGRNAKEIASFTVVGPNVYEADRLATAAFAMGKRGLELIARIPDVDAYMIEHNGIATYTDGLLRYITP